MGCLRPEWAGSSFLRPEWAGIMNAGATQSPGRQVPCWFQRPSGPTVWLLQARMGRQCNGSREEKLIWGMVIVSALRAFTTEVPADRGSGSHGSHCTGPPGLSSQECMPSGPEQPEMPSGPEQPEALRPSGVFPYR